MEMKFSFARDQIHDPFRATDLQTHTRTHSSRKRTFGYPTAHDSEQHTHTYQTNTKQKTRRKATYPKPPSNSIEKSQSKPEPTSYDSKSNSKSNKDSTQILYLLKKLKQKDAELSAYKHEVYDVQQRLQNLEKERANRIRSTRSEAVEYLKRMLFDQNNLLAELRSEIDRLKLQVKHQRIKKNNNLSVEIERDDSGENRESQVGDRVYALECALEASEEEKRALVKALDEAKKDRDELLETSCVLEEYVYTMRQKQNLSNSTDKSPSQSPILASSTTSKSNTIDKCTTIENGIEAASKDQVKELESELKKLRSEKDYLSKENEALKERLRNKGDDVGKGGGEHDADGEIVLKELLAQTQCLVKECADQRNAVDRLKQSFMSNKM